MDIHRDLTIDTLELTLAPGTDAMPFQPVVHAGTVHLSNVAFVKIVQRLLADEIVVPQAKLHLRSCRLIEGGAEVVMRAKTALLDSNLTVRASFIPAGNGDLRVTVTYMRLGMLAASWVLDLVLGSVDRYPGLRKSGAKSIDINLPTVLQSRNVPIQLDAGVEAVRVTEHLVTLTLA